jgi:hypothetical protein
MSGSNAPARLETRSKAFRSDSQALGYGSHMKTIKTLQHELSALSLAARPERLGSGSHTKPQHLWFDSHAKP